MNILQINTYDGGTGAANIAWSIKSGMVKRGHETSMFVWKKISDDVNVFSLPRILHRYFHYLISNDIDLFGTDRILKTREFKKADIVHCHNLHGWYFSLNTLHKMSMLKPVMWTLHDMWAITPHCAHAFDGEVKDGFFQCSSLKIYPRLYWHNEKYLCWRKRRILENSNFHIVTPSLWLKNKIDQSLLKDKPIKLIHNGIDPGVFYKKDKKHAREILDLPMGKKIVLFVADGGKHNIYKGWEYVEKALNYYETDSNILFLCIGGKKEDQELNKVSNIKLIPKINDRELLMEYYNASDLLIFTSVAENFSLVLLEAMSCGLPVVTFDVGGNKEIVQHGENGYVVEYKNINDLIMGINMITNLSDNDYQLMSDNCIMRVKNNFTKEKMVDEYCQMYENISMSS